MKTPDGTNEYAVEPFPLDQRPDESGAAAITRLMARYGWNYATALDIIGEVQEAFGLGGADVGTGDDTSAVRRVMERHRQALHILVAYQEHQKTVVDMQMSTRVLALELGYTTVAGAADVAELARKLGLQKQTVNKCAENFQRKLGLPPRAGQRGAAARANMRQARQSQLAGTKKF